MTKHVLEVDGYFATSEERAFEGVMFQVHITETSGDLVIDDVTMLKEDASYLKKYRMEPFYDEVRTHVQDNIDHLKRAAAKQGKTINDLMDEWPAEAAKHNLTEDRIDLLNEV